MSSANPPHFIFLKYVLFETLTTKTDINFRGIISPRTLISDLNISKFQNHVYEPRFELHINVFLIIFIGTLNDPDELPGLTNLVGRMLTSGTTTHPERNAFLNFVKSNEGQYFKFPETKEDQQIFSFQIGTSSLAPALER